MRNNPGGGEFYPAKGVRTRCKKNSPSVLSCIGQRTREGCDRGSEGHDNSQRIRRGRASSSEESEEIWKENLVAFENENVKWLILSPEQRISNLLRYYT